jgi:hypothetical protein
MGEWLSVPSSRVYGAVECMLFMKSDAYLCHTDHNLLVQTVKWITTVITTTKDLMLRKFHAHLLTKCIFVEV